MTDVSPVAHAGPRGAAVRIAVIMCSALGIVGCEQPDSELIPDEVLQVQLGLTVEDRVHTVRVEAGTEERPIPRTVTVRPGDWVQFVSADHFVHEVGFYLDSLGGAARAFLVRTGQDASPPLVEEDARFVVSFAGAPVGRYPYGLSGNRGPGWGEIVVEDPPR
ncbi:MAG: hypothetical protein OEN56_02395 [Gemmatimonadota bacterium]|nr:hypothetical protein [Gemmatimonadota bacterium]MDH3424615.1 hypothetical protein [Gemmatimonadota bacterium]